MNRKLFAYILSIVVLGSFAQMFAMGDGSYQDREQREADAERVSRAQRGGFGAHSYRYSGYGAGAAVTGTAAAAKSANPSDYYNRPQVYQHPGYQVPVPAEFQGHLQPMYGEQPGYYYDLQ